MSTNTPLDFVLSAAVSVDTTPTADALSPEPSMDMKFAGALTFSDDGILFVGDNHNGAIYAFEIPGEEPPGQTVPRSIRNIDAKIAELLGVRLGAVEINDLAVHPISNEIYISVTRIESFASQPAIVTISADQDISLLDTSSLSFQKQGLTEFPDGDTSDVVIHASKVDVFDEAQVTKLIEKDKKFTVKSFAKKTVAKAKPARPVSTGTRG